MQSKTKQKPMTTENTKSPRACEREFEFTLAISVPEDAPAIEDALFEAGCDDATIAVRSGNTFVAFSRLAPSMIEAISSAIADVRKSGIGAKVLRVEYCNLVTQADIGRKIGRSRQLVHQYVSGARGPGGFPSPECSLAEAAPLWRWCEVAYWLWQNNLIEENAARDAEAVEAVNSYLEYERNKRSRRDLLARLKDAIEGRS